MKEYIFLICFLLSTGASISLMAQSLSFTLANEQISSDEQGSYYEADVQLAADQSFTLGSGQLYFNYDTIAFGTNIIAGGAVAFSYPETSILATTYSGSFNFYQNFIANDNTAGRFSFSWQQGGASAGCLNGDNIGSDPALLFRVRISYLEEGAGQTGLLCFESSAPFDQQTFIACGPSNSCAATDCLSYPPGQLTEDQFACFSGESTIWYADADQDGYGNPSVSVEANTQPAGFVADHTDCDDQDPDEYPDQIWYDDQDGDGMSTGQTLTQCERPEGYFTTEELVVFSGDNCPDTYNPSQTDQDGAGIGDACDCDPSSAADEYLLVIDFSGQPDPVLPGGTYRANQEMEVRATVSAGEPVILTAGQKVTLRPGFVAASESELQIYIDNCSDPQTPERRTVPATVEVRPATTGFKAVLFPNPVSTSATLSLSLTTEERLKLQIFDLSGRQQQTLADRVFASGISQLSLDAQSMADGIYFLKIQTAQQIETLRFTVQR